jgi:hypothetical protein
MPIVATPHSPRCTMDSLFEGLDLKLWSFVINTVVHILYPFELSKCTHLESLPNVKL